LLHSEGLEKGQGHRVLDPFGALFATKATTCYAGGKGKALARKEVTK